MATTNSISLKIKILVVSYLLLHLGVSILGIRIWPFTDYPMFGEAVPKGTPITAHYITYKDPSGSLVSLNTTGFGVGNFVIDKYASTENWAAIHNLIKSKEIKFPQYVQKFSILKRFAKIMANGDIEVQEEVIYEGDL